MADRRTVWDVAIEYKWPLIAVAGFVAASQGWVEVPILDWGLAWIERLIRAVFSGGA